MLSSLVSFYAPVSVILYAYYRIYAAAAAQLRSIERGSKVMTTATFRDGREMTTLRIHRGGGGGGSAAAGALDAGPSRRTSRQPSLVEEPGCQSVAADRSVAAPRRWKTLTFSTSQERKTFPPSSTLYKVHPWCQGILVMRLTESRFCVPLDTRPVISANLLADIEDRTSPK